MIDKARATAAKRSLFGFSIPNFGGLFGGGENDVKQIESTIATVGQQCRRRLAAEARRWLGPGHRSTMRSWDFRPSAAKKWSSQRGSLRSFYFQLGKQPGFKVKRIG